jgi:hypothetical protein
LRQTLRNKAFRQTAIAHKHLFCFVTDLLEEAE